MGVVTESTYNWYWLVDGLQDKGYEVYLAANLLETVLAVLPQY
jgi:hypothetical protein